MSDLFEINAAERVEFGKGATRRLRREDRVPAIIYGAGKEPQAIVLEQNEIAHVLENEAAYSHILKIKMDNKTQRVVLKAIERHPFKPKIEHVDFLRVKATDKLTMNVPLHFEGGDECPGVKEGDGENVGVVIEMMTELEIKCLPADLPEFIAVDISHMTLGQTLHLTDVKLPSGVELAAGEIDAEHDHPVVAVQVPKEEIIEEEPVEQEAAEGEAQDAAAEGEEGAEGEAQEGEQAGEEEKKED